MDNTSRRTFSRLLFAALLAGSTAVLAIQAARSQTSASNAMALTGNPSRGKVLYQGCEDCHSLDENEVGPKHRGVVGRPAGTIADYRYSPALKNSGLVWDEANLDRWLTNPSALVPGTKMFFKVNKAQDRADIIAFLREQN